MSESGESFEKLLVWQRARAVSVRIYRLLHECRDYHFKNQITDAANSISSNIAEGAERLSKAEFKQFLAYAKGSAGEARSQSYLAMDLGYLTESDAQALQADLKEISRMIHGLIRKLDPPST